LPVGQFFVRWHFLRQPGGKICRKAIAVAKSSLISIAPLKGFEPAPQLVANVPCAGTCFIYLRPTAMPVGLAGLNKNKIVLRAVLGTADI